MASLIGGWFPDNVYQMSIGTRGKKQGVERWHLHEHGTVRLGRGLGLI